MKERSDGASRGPANPAEREAVAAWLAAGRYPKVAAWCRERLAQDATASRYWAWLGESLRGQGMAAAACRCFERASILDPQAAWLEAAARVRGPGDSRIPRWLGRLLAVPRVTVAAALVVRDEAATVGEAIARLIPAVDEVVVADTGSRDQTPDLAREAGARVLEVGWEDDFARARNQALAAVTAQWVLWVDGDEWLEPADVAVPRLVAGIFHAADPPAVLRVVQLNAIGERVQPSYEVARMFATGRGLCWRGRVHEQVVRPGPQGALPLSWPLVRIRLHHRGYQPDVMRTRGKLERNIRLLRMAVGEDPEDVAAWGFLGRELFFAGDYEEAAAALERAERLAADHPQYARVAEVRTLLAETLLRQDRLGEAWQVAERLVAEAPDYPTAWFVRGQVALRLAVSWVASAQQAFSQVRTAAAAYRGQLGWDPEVAEWKTDLGLGDAAKLSGNWGEAVRRYRAVQAAWPSPEVDRQLARIREEARAALEALGPFPT